MKFLVIEDKEMVRLCLEKLLEATYAGCEITFGCDERQGLELIKSNPPFDLVISDLDTPTENGGLLVIKAAKERNRETPVILMTGGRTDEDLAQLAQEAGADGCLGKPFALDKLRAEVSRVLTNSYHPV